MNCSDFKDFLYNKMSCVGVLCLRIQYGGEPKSRKGKVEVEEYWLEMEQHDMHLARVLDGWQF